MSIVEQYGKRRSPKMEPQMPAPRLTEGHALHPAAQEAAAVYSQALEEVDRLRAELTRVREEGNETVRQLRADLDVERRSAGELQRMLDEERRRANYYHAYAVEVRTHLNHVAQAAIKANDVALKIADDDAARRIESVSGEIERSSLAAVETALTPEDAS